MTVFEIVIVIFACFGFVCSLVLSFVLGAAINYSIYKEKIERKE